VRTFLRILFIGLAAALVYQCSAESQRLHQTKKQVAEKARSELSASIGKMVKETNAVADWEMILARGKEFRVETVLTLELERLWLQGRPILFYGSIIDIKTQNAESYLLTIRPGMTSLGRPNFATDLELSLVCEKSKVDTFLVSHPKLFEDAGFNNEVAVVADIHRIRTEQSRPQQEEEGDKDVRVGDGNCVRLLLIGDAIF
jgi:hypothetical protein